MVKNKPAIVKATLNNKDIIKLKYGEWNGLESDILELDCGYKLDGSTELQPISMLKNLKKLVIYGAFINDLSFVLPLQQLEVLDCAINHISDITPLKNLKSLKELALAENNISDISPLENLENLTELDVSDNCIKSLEPVAKMKNLKLIDFVYQSPLIKDLTPLKQLKDLKIAMIGKAPVSYVELKAAADKYNDIKGLIECDYKM